jgi:hypothetical protein
VVDDLEVPLAFAGGRIETHERFRKEVGARPAAAVVVVARRADRQVHEAPFGVQRHGRPDVGVAGELPRVLLPRLVAELAGLGNGVERPHQLAGPRVKRPHVARRVVSVHQAVAYAAPYDHEIAVHDGRRRVGVVPLVDRPQQPLGQVDLAAVAERSHAFSGCGVERDQAIAAVDEDPQRVAVAPGGDAAMHEALPAGRLPIVVGLRVVLPQLAPGRGIERNNAVVRRADVEHAVDHQRRCLKRARERAQILEGLLAGFPLPRDLESRVTFSRLISVRGEYFSPPGSPP